MNIREKKKKLAKAKRLRKVEKEVICIGAGAGWWWQKDDGYLEYQDDNGVVLGLLLEGIRFHFDLPMDSSLFAPWKLKEFDNPKSAAKAIIGVIDHQKWLEKRRTEKEG